MDTSKRPKIELGDKVRDTISGFTGIVICVSNWLNGCQRIAIQPQGLHEGSPIPNATFDAEQLEIVSQNTASTGKRTGGPAIAPTRAADPMR